jgi:hypothetical protein
MNLNQTIIKMVLDRWYGNLKSFDAVLHSITDEQLEREVSPGKNRGVYLLGHLIAVHDDMLRLLNLGNKEYPGLDKIFLEAPDKSIPQIPSATELRKYWVKQGEMLSQKFESFQPDHWFEKHTAVSIEDFNKEPHRNKLNILLTRSTHLAYHTGQFILLKY